MYYLDKELKKIRCKDLLPGQIYTTPVGVWLIVSVDHTMVNNELFINSSFIIVSMADYPKDYDQLSMQEPKVNYAQTDLSLSSRIFVFAL